MFTILRPNYKKLHNLTLSINAKKMQLSSLFSVLISPKPNKLCESKTKQFNIISTIHFSFQIF